MPRWGRRLIWALLALLLLPVLVLAGGLAWLNTGPGQRSLERLAEGQVPGLQIEGLRGPLPGHPGLERLVLADAEGPWLEVRQARLDLDLRALLGGTLQVALLEAETVRLLRLPAGDATEPPAEPPGETVLPQLPDLPLALRVERLAIQRLELAPEVAGQAVTASVEGEAALANGALQAGLRLRRLDAGGSADLRLALAPGADRLDAELALQEPAGGLLPTLLGQPAQPLDAELRLAGPASGAALRLRASLGPEITLGAEGQVSATPEGALSASLRGEASAAPLLPEAVAPLATPLGFTLDAGLDPARHLALRRLVLEAPAGRLALEGGIDLGSEALALEFRLDAAESARFAALLPPGIAWQDLHAEGRITGTLAQPAIVAELRPQGLATGTPPLDAALGPAPLLSLRASLPGPRLDLRLEGAEALLTAEGSLASPADLLLRLDLPRLAALGPGFQGALAAEARLQGELSDPAISITARSDRLDLGGRSLEALRLEASIANPLSAPRAEARLDGRFAGLPLSLRLDGRPEGSLLRLEQAEARLGPARLTLAGTLDPAGPLFAGEARLEAGELAPFAALAGLPDLAGRLNLEAQLTPREAAAGAAAVQGFDVTLAVPAFTANGLSGSLTATARGTPEALEFSAQARAPQGSAETRGRLAAADGGWRLELGALEARAAGETLRLAAPAQLTLGADGGITLSPLALTTGRGGRLQASGRWGPQNADLTASLTALPLALAEAFAPGLAVQGSLSGELRASGPVARPEIRATLNGSGIRSAAPWATGLPALGLRAEASMQGEAAEARARIDLGPAGSLEARASLPSGFGERASLTASLDGTLSVAPLAAPFLAGGANRVAGRLAVALRAEGPLAAPRLGGRATLSGGSFRNPVLGVALSAIQGAVVGEGTQLVIEGLRAQTLGGGSIVIRGGVDLAGDGLPVDLGLTARNARPVSSDLVTGQLDADLTLRGPLLGDASLGGTVLVRQAEIRLPERLPTSVASLPEVRFRGRPPPGAVQTARRATPTAAAGGNGGNGLPPIALSLRVEVERLFVRGRGLDVELGGEVQVGGTLAEPVPQGELRLRRGTLDVLARQLSFTRGTIGFTSGTLMPTLDLAAQSRTANATITVTVQGSPTAPEIGFSSSPELPQDEVLARLLFDRPTSNLSPFEIAQIAEAVAQLTGVSGGSAALSRIRGALGLDRLGVTSGTDGRGPAVEAGRYVAPGVFLGVRQGTTGQTGVGVEVEITPRLKLEGQTATGPAGDRLGLSYELEY